MKKQYMIGLILVLLCSIFAFPVQAAEKPYAIDVNLTQNIVTVYSKDADGEYTIAEQAFVCSVGPETPSGTFYTSSKYEWRPLFGNVYGQYATRITGSILFHSVPYLEQDKSTLEWWEYNKLGTSASMGCVRLTVEDVKWIYDNCPIGTAVTMYYSDEVEPLIPETPQIIDGDSVNSGWDPTDPDPENPWSGESVMGVEFAEEELIETTLPILGFTKNVTVYHKGDFYGLNSSNARLIWGLLGTPLLLPNDLVGDAAGGEVSIFHNTITNTVSYYKNGSMLYYSIADLTGFTDVTFAESDGFIFTNASDKTLSLSLR
ncbi:L,D-transpeptidase [Chakrabartyella piscis]|uniref:L,D-transpeptidase n=1 Tax=Chakrabartyella piscis TaxID=2918914 RepID=UPI0029589F5D|nr:L,D-transpeptidase [Chakrabartyella piscis]